MSIYVQKIIFPNLHLMGMGVGVKYQTLFARNCMKYQGVCKLEVGKIFKKKKLCAELDISCNSNKEIF